jgi:hypothetical protein
MEFTYGNVEWEDNLPANPNISGNMLIVVPIRMNVQDAQKLAMDIENLISEKLQRVANAYPFIMKEV